MKTAIYYRVSTSEQTTEPQRRELLEYCARRGWADVAEYADTISGAKFTRFGLDRLMGDVRKGKVGTVVVVKLDRLGRSLPHLALLLQEFLKLHVALVSTSQGIDTSDGNPMGKMMCGILSVFAEFELDIIRERTKAGLANARANGVRLGRVPFDLTTERKATLAAFVAQRREALAKGEKPPSYPSLAKRLVCSLGKAHSLAQEAMGNA